MESRNVTLIETPQDVRRMQEDERHHDDLARRVYPNDVMDNTSFLGPVVLGLSRGASRDEVEELREEIESMVRENTAQIESSEEGGTSTARTSAPSPGVTRRVNVATHSGTRANPSNTEGGTSTADPWASSPGVASREMCCDSLMDTRQPQRRRHRRRSARKQRSSQ